MRAAVLGCCMLAAVLFASVPGCVGPIAVGAPDPCGDACCVGCSCCALDGPTPYCSARGASCVAAPPSSSSSSGSGTGGPPGGWGGSNSSGGPQVFTLHEDCVRQAIVLPFEPGRGVEQVAWRWVNCGGLIAGQAFDSPITGEPPDAPVLEFTEDGRFNWLTVDGEGQLKTSPLPWYHGSATLEPSAAGYQLSLQTDDGTAFTFDVTRRKFSESWHAQLLVGSTPFVALPPPCATDAGAPISGCL